MKRIMFLGGSTQQIPAIEYARKHGYYTILCDYLQDNPGQNYAHEFYCVSTTDKESILEVAMNTSIDGIVAYASDPAAPTAAYVGSKLSLPSNPYKSVEILSRKDLFREFLRDNKFNSPKAKSFTTLEVAKASLEEFNFPIMVKPIDSSGSKGVTRIEFKEEFENAFVIAMDNSREKVIIIEEFIDRAHDCMIGGDGFVIDGKVEFFGLLNSHRNVTLNPFVPIGTSYPIFLSQDKIDIVKNEVQRVVDLLNIKMGALNLELMFDKKDKLYIIEIGPRNGGNMIPDLLEITTGVDLVGATVESALGNDNIRIQCSQEEKYYSTYVLHSTKNGILKDMIFSEEIEKNITKKIMYKDIGSQVEIFDGSNKALGIIFLKYDSLEEEKYIMDNMNKFIDIQVI